MSELLVPNGFEATDFYGNRVSKRIVEDRDSHPYVAAGKKGGSISKRGKVKQDV